MITTSKTSVLDTPVIIIVNTTNGSNTVSSAFTLWIDPGDFINSANFPAGTYCTSKTASTVTFSSNATVTQSNASLPVYALNEGIICDKYYRVIGPTQSVAVYKVNVAVKNSLEIQTDERIQLKGDSSNPGIRRVYSTNSLGNRGWYDISNLLAGAIFSDTDTTPTTIPTGSSVVGSSLSLSAGTYLIFCYAKIVRQVDGQVYVRINDGGVSILLTACEVSSPDVMNMNFNWSGVYTSSSAIALTSSFEGDFAQNNGLRDRSLIALRVG